MTWKTRYIGGTVARGGSDSESFTTHLCEVAEALHPPTGYMNWVLLDTQTPASPPRPAYI